jgi:hypothetical protein
MWWVGLRDELHHLLTEPSSDGDEMKPEEDNEDVSSFILLPNDSEPEDGITSFAVPRENQTQRYKRALRLGKEIARRVAGNDAQYDTVIDRLRDIMDSLTIPIEGEVHDAAEKPKGRPRKRGHSHLDRESRPYCVLCQAESHNLLDCRHYHTSVRNRRGVHQILGTNATVLSVIILDIEETLVPYWTLREGGSTKNPDEWVENESKRCQRAKSDWKATGGEDETIYPLLESVASPCLAAKHSNPFPVISVDAS